MLNKCIILEYIITMIIALRNQKVALMHRDCNAKFTIKRQNDNIQSVTLFEINTKMRRRIYIRLELGWASAFTLLLLEGNLNNAHDICIAKNS